MTVLKLTKRAREYIKHLSQDGQNFEFEAIQIMAGDRVHGGLMAAAPTTPSTQATGATGNTTWRVNVDKGMAVIGAKVYEIAASADLAVAAAGNLGLINGDSMVAALVAKVVSGTLTLQAVLGAPAVTGSQVPPTDGAILTAVGSSNWVRLAHLTINRTADTTVTQSQDNTVSDRGLVL